MIFTSPRPPFNVPKKDILSYMFVEDDWKHGWEKQLYIDAEDPSQFVTAGQLLSLTKRIGRGLRECAGVRTGDVVLLSATNSVDIPALMLGIMVAALNYSSGTTGLPKGCMITMYNTVAHCEQQRILHDLGREKLREQGVSIPDNDTVIAFLPFYHAFGQQHYIFNAPRNGDTTYVMSSFSFPALLCYIPEYRITTFAAVPPVAVLLAKHPDTLKTDFSSLHSILCGAAPLGAETQLKAEAAMNTYKKGNVRITQGWGMSEGVCGSCTIALHERDPDVSGVGYLLSNMSARIVPVDGSDYSKSLGFNEEGEVLLKGPNIFPGYWKREKETREAFTDDGWYKTGDIGVMKRDGIMHIVDRKKELIKVQAFQVAPAELEDLLLKSADVDDVAVIGIPGEGTEYPRAYVVPSTSRRSSNAKELQALADDISRFVAATFHVTYQHPDGDIVLRASDGLCFRIHTIILRLASGFLLDIPRVPSESPTDAIPLSEPSAIIACLLNLIYPTANGAEPDGAAHLPKITSFAFARDNTNTTDDYEIPRALAALRAIVSVRMDRRGTHRIDSHAFAALATSAKLYFPEIYGSGKPLSFTRREKRRSSGSSNSLSFINGNADARQAWMDKDRGIMRLWDSMLCRVIASLEASPLAQETFWSKKELKLWNFTCHNFGNIILNKNHFVKRNGEDLQTANLPAFI
ncbi:acetyl-CoA synthetase-like protein [Sanghuangporus baumii]|uniref:Acetyl-CoA synthetase-like protein n=1 Tax=Sanghuangporus baumii TaxID=108892 RepID=A0A9Q5I0F1_SANBA|nr:acetyl-CoA synthetase-like protein [Sanghuangporus baumii]